MIPTAFRQFTSARVASMRPTQRAMNAAKKSGVRYPVEITPLFLAMGVAVCSASCFSGKKFLYDDSLRVGKKNPDQSHMSKALEQDE